MKSSFLATKSVSEFTSTTVALVLSSLIFIATKPSAATLSAFLAALDKPYSSVVTGKTSVVYPACLKISTVKSYHEIYPPSLVA